MLNHTALFKQALSLNRQVLLECLAPLGVSEVCVVYAGGGDSGGVEELSVTPVSLDTVLEKESIALWQVAHAQEDWRLYQLVLEKPCSLAEALKRYALDCVESLYPGWEINDGSSGTFTIDVTAWRCALEHREFYTESSVYEHAL